MKYINNNGKEIFMPESKMKELQELNLSISQLEDSIELAKKCIEVVKGNPESASIINENDVRKLAEMVNKLGDLRDRMLKQGKYSQ